MNCIPGVCLRTNRLKRILAPLLICVAFTAHAQEPQFSVATIRPSTPDTPTSTQIRGKRFVTEGTTFLDLFRYAYTVHAAQVIGGPDWLGSDKFDVVAVPEGEQRPGSDAIKQLVQRLLMERFHVVMRTETRQLPVFALERAGTALKLTPSSSKPGDMPAGGGDNRNFVAMHNGTMQEFAGYLQRFGGTAIDRPVVDQTGLVGRYDVQLRFTAEPSASTESSFPGLFTAIREQLGLALKPTRAPVRVFVIGSATRPSLDS